MACGKRRPSSTRLRGGDDCTVGALHAWPGAQAVSPVVGLSGSAHPPQEKRAFAGFANVGSGCRRGVVALPDCLHGQQCRRPTRESEQQQKLLHGSNLENNGWPPSDGAIVTWVR